MWVPKRPKRYDFCGCPPCGLCFDWIEDRPIELDENFMTQDLVPPEGYRIDGVRKMTEDLLGKNVTPTTEQKQQIYEGAVLVHERNKLKKGTQQEQIQETIDESFTRRGVEGFLNQKAKEKAVVRKPLNTVNIDDIADKKKEEKVPEEVAEKIKNNVTIPTGSVPTASKSAPLDYDLLQREKQARRSRDDMIEAYRQNLAREKAKWDAMYSDPRRPDPRRRY